MPKMYVIFIGLMISCAQVLAAPITIEVDDAGPSFLQVQKVDILANASSEWQPTALRIWVNDKTVYQIFAANGSEALSLRNQILIHGHIQCQVKMNSICSSYKISSPPKTTASSEI